MTGEIERRYGIAAQALSIIPAGIGGTTYLVSSDQGKYVLKSVKQNRHLPQEPAVAYCLRMNGIPVADYIPTVEGVYFWNRAGNVCFMQRFVEGTVHRYNDASAWFMKESARILGRMHAALKSLPSLPIGMGEDFIEFIFSKRPGDSYKRTLLRAKRDGDRDIEADLAYRLSQLGNLKREKLDFARLTRLNTHGDYKISNVVCGQDRVNAVIDLSGACVHPAVWEIIRSFVYADPGCASGCIGAAKLIEYVKEYLQYAPLTEYDIETMPYYFYCQILVSNYYEQYYASAQADRDDVMMQAVLSTRLIKWFEGHMEELSHELVRATRGDF